jgi:hypothetical protein
MEFPPMPEELKKAYQITFYLESTTEQERIAILRRIRLDAHFNGQADGVPWNFCIGCHCPVVLAGYTKPLMEGHVYSEKGHREFHQSGLCEWCFDISMITSLDELDFEPTYKFKFDFYMTRSKSNVQDD